MTALELARRDLAKQERSLAYAERQGQPAEQVEHIKELIRLRRAILADVVRGASNDCG